MSEHVLYFPSECRGPYHVEGPPGRLIEGYGVAERTVTSIVLDAGANEGGREPHNNAAQQGEEVAGEEAHGSQGRPEEGKKEEGLYVDGTRTPAPPELEFVQPLAYPFLEGRVEGRGEGVEGRLIVEEGTNFVLLQYGGHTNCGLATGDYGGVVRLPKNRGILRAWARRVAKRRVEEP